MNTSHDDLPALGAHLLDDLSQFEIQIAHRADELWRSDGQGRGSDVEFWLRAEREVMERRLARARADLRQIT